MELLLLRGEVIENRREDVVQRGIKYHERGDVEIEHSLGKLGGHTMTLGGGSQMAKQFSD